MLPDSKEVHEFAVHFVRVGPGYAVRPILHHHQPASLDRFVGALSRGADRHNPVRIAMNDKRGHVDTGQVLAEVLMPCRNASNTGGSRGVGCNVPTGLDDLFADARAQQEIRVVEIPKKHGEERITVCGDVFLDPVEDAAVHPSGLSGVFSRKGGTAEMNTALLTPFDPYFPM